MYSPIIIGEDNIFLCFFIGFILKFQFIFQVSEHKEIKFHHSHQKYTFFHSFIGLDFIADKNLLAFFHSYSF